MTAPLVLKLPENLQGRDFVVGDIHGQFDVLEQALAAVDFDPAKDRLIAVGDLVDRGPQSARCLEFLKQPWFYAIKGNHETLFMMIFNNGDIDYERCARNLKNGAGWIVTTDPELLREINDAMASLPIAIELPSKGKTIGFVHAEVTEGLDWDAFKQKVSERDKDTIIHALLSRKRTDAQDTTGVAGIDRIFCGHTPQKEGPGIFGNCINVDTGGCFRNAEKPHYFLTLGDITAPDADFSAKASSPDNEFRIITGPLPPPPQRKPAHKKRNGPRP